MTSHPQGHLGIEAVATRKANRGVKHVLENQASQQNAKKRKRYTNFSDTDRAEIRQYTAEFVCGARRADGSKTRFVGLRTSVLPGLPAPPIRS